MDTHYKDSRNKIDKALTVAGVILVLTATSLMFAFFMHGETKIKGEHESDITNTSLTCSSNDFLYPFLTYDNSITKHFKAIILFDDQKINTISIIQELNYQTKEQADASYSANGTNLGLAISNDGLKRGSISENFSKQENQVTMSIYATKLKLNNDVIKKYFLLENIDLNAPIDTYQRRFIKHGLSCTINN